MYANGTPHYNLPQTVGTDKRDWADTNQAFADVDADLHTAVETASSAAGSVAGLAVTVAHLGDAQITFQHDLDDLELTVGQQGNAITANANRIEEVEDDALDMICAVDEGTAQVATVAVAEGKYFRYNNVMYQATTNIAIGDTIVPNTNCRATNVATELENITPGGEVIDVTARAGVAENATHIGTMANLQTTDKTSLVAAINEVLSQIGGGGMPELDFANKVDIGTTSYTTLKAGAVFIVGNTSSGVVTITADAETIGKLTVAENNVANSCIHFIPAGTALASSTAIPTSASVYFVPYKTA